MSDSNTRPVGYAIDPENGEVIAKLMNEDVFNEFQSDSYWKVETA